MDGPVINLRQKRKTAKRQQDSQKAAENRALYGRPTHEKKLDAAQAKLKGKQLDGHHLSPTPPADDQGDTNE
jgi:hypothetical protein